MVGEVLSNVIGAPFDQYIIDQLNVRAANNSSQTRTDEQVLFLANKMSWSRLSSSVRITPKNATLTEFYRSLFNSEVPPGDYSAPDSLAKNWILEAGTSIYNNGSYSLRSGLGPNGAYGLGGLQQGYRPMPGIETISVESKGVLGSLREANITFKVWNITQLNVIEALYFRLGYTMLLEWGHVNYFNNKKTYVAESGGIDLFTMKSKEDLLQNITQKTQETDGNYEAMLGVVTNFYFSFNQDGGYDCNLKLIGLGSVIDTIRINQVYIMPDVLAQKIQQQKDIIQANIEKEKQRLADVTAKNERGTLPPLVKPAVDLAGIKDIINSDLGTTAVNDAQVKSITYSTITDPNNNNTNQLADYYYKAVQGGKSTNFDYVKELNTTRTGLFLNPIPGIRSNFQVLYAENPQSVILSSGLLTLGAVRALNAQDIEDPWTSGRYENSDLTDALGTDTIAKLFDLSIRDSKGLSLQSKVNNAFSREVAPNDPIGQITAVAGNDIITEFFSALIGANQLVGIPFAYSYTGLVKSPFNGSAIKKRFHVIFTYQPPATGAPTRQEFAAAFQRWFTYSRKVNVTSVTQTGTSIDSRIVVGGVLSDFNVPNKEAPVVSILFDNTAMIQAVVPDIKQDAPIPPITQTANPQGDTVGGENETSSDQGQEINKYDSALHAMLTAVLAQGWSNATKAPQDQAVIATDLTELTKLFYQSGVMKDVFSTVENRPAVAKTSISSLYAQTPTAVPFNLTNYAIKGFNSSIMASQKKYGLITDVDFKSLSTAYLLKYDFSEGDTIQQAAGQYPVYIKFGYLLAFLNNMCTLYETKSSKNNTEIKPYVYIDFHPDYNFCLTNPQHLTVDPYKVLIPLQCSDKQYYELFPLEVRDALKDVIFKPETQNTVSTFIGQFKTDNPYQGKTMEILLNCQYLLDIANSYLKTNNEGAVILKPFLDRIVDDINKSTGGFNLFRVAYRDDSNTVIIKDDQFVPALQNEPNILPQQYYFANKRYAEIPVYASGSIAREMEFKTNMSTKMSSMIAISAQAGKSVVNSTDATPIGTYNDNYEDAFMNVKVNSANQGSSTTTATQDEAQRKLNTNVEIAKKFNAHVTSVYYSGYVYKGQVDSAITYYIDRQRTRKAEDPVTSAAPFIPANISITVDGISGIVMGNAFTIPENRLPATFRGRDLQTKIGFIVVGLSHALEGNQWLTKIRGQMIRLRDSVSYGSVAKIGSLEGNVTRVFTARVVDLSSINLNADWLTIAFSFVTQREGYLSAPQWDYTRWRAGYGSDTLIQANGAEVEVTESTRFTREDADRTLKIQLAGDYAKGVINQIGQKQWDALTARQKAALVSYAYNAGPGALAQWGITKAIKSNSTAQQISALIKRGPITATDTRTKKTETLQALVDRRAAEAQLYLS